MPGGSSTLHPSSARLPWPSSMWAGLGSSLVLTLGARLWVTTRQDSLHATDCELASPLSGHCRGASSTKVSPDDGRQLPRWLGPSSGGSFLRWLTTACSGRTPHSHSSPTLGRGPLSTPMDLSG